MLKFDISCFKNENYVISTPYMHNGYTSWTVNRKDGGAEKLLVVNRRSDAYKMSWCVYCYDSEGAIFIDAVVCLDEHASVTLVMSGDGTNYRSQRYLKKWQEVLTPIIQRIAASIV